MVIQILQRLKSIQYPFADRQTRRKNQTLIQSIRSKPSSNVPPSSLTPTFVAQVTPVLPPLHPKPTSYPWVLRHLYSINPQPVGLQAGIDTHLDEFEAWIKKYYDLLRSRNLQNFLAQEKDFRLLKDQADIGLILKKMRTNIPSEDQPSQESAHMKPTAFSDPPTESAPKSKDFATTILAQLDEKDAQEVGAALMLNRYELPIFIYRCDGTTFTLRRSEQIFHYSEIKQDGLLENLKELEMNPSEKGSAWSDITFSIESPYWRLYRRDHNGDRFFVAPKSEAKSLKKPGTKDEMWIREDGAGDTFLALGWLIEENKDAPRATRYVCALNTSTKPVSMWLIYDYRQPNDDDYLYTSDVPTLAKQNLYLDPADNGQVIANPPKGPAPVTGEEGVQQNLHKGYMDQPKPWDIACLYEDAERQWPKVSRDAASYLDDTSSPTPYGDPDTRLRAKRIA